MLHFNWEILFDFFIPFNIYQSKTRGILLPPYNQSNILFENNFGQVCGKYMEALNERSGSRKVEVATQSSPT